MENEVMSRERIKEDIERIQDEMSKTDVTSDKYKELAKTLGVLYDIYAKQDKDDLDCYIKTEELNMKKEEKEFNEQQEKNKAAAQRSERINKIVVSSLTGLVGLTAVKMVTSFELEGIVKSKAFSIVSKMIPIIKS